MPNPFPGMNPYLETTEFWKGVHDGLIFTLNEALNKTLPPGFVARIGERVYVVEPGRGLYPDVLIRENRSKTSGGSPAESQTAVVATPAAASAVADPPLIFSLQSWTARSTFVEVIAPRSPSRVVSVIEILSYSNKAATGPDRAAYLAKQRDLINSSTNLVEIDLLRGGEPTIAPPPAFLAELSGGPFDYAICLHRADAGNQFEAWTRTVREALPRFIIPLTEDTPDVPVNLQNLLNRVYEAGAHDELINYLESPEPPLSPLDEKWADTLLKQEKRR